MSQRKQKTHNSDAPLVNSHEAGIHKGKGLCLSEHGCMEEPPALCLGDGWKQGEHARPTLLSGMQEGLGWDKGMQNFTMTQTL